MSRLVVIARFLGKIELKLAGTLRSIGFRWNRFLKQWEEAVLYDEAAALVEGQGGVIVRVEGKA